MEALIPFTTSGSLVDLVDKKVLVILRDGRKIIGVFRSYDQFANFLMESVVERLYHKMEYADRDIGILLVRGENVVAVGEIDLIAEDLIPLREISVENIMTRITEDNTKRDKDQIIKENVLREYGFVSEGREGDAY
ncbi:U6 snRNA-associated Sm-like protein LSm1 [Tremella mesenterica]|uniref:U6 snRNA-associated Sm-like protein LSm1 n=1 Tax=Tremella mesenterica TaxID=5217 RepID=A0A4Q1BIK8_TREME|nr:U6 snRNA-associated Sm-like protein LSm1 [Tremella mesenterica]